MSQQLIMGGKNAPPPAIDDSIDIKLLHEDETFDWYSGTVIAKRQESLGSKKLDSVTVFKIKFEPDEPSKSGA